MQDLTPVLLEVAGEDWPNFEYGPEARTVPKDIASMDELDADDWEIGCGIGDANELCALWTFRGRYGRVLMDVEFFSASGGGIRFEAMRNLVRSIDRETADRANG